MLLHGVSLNPFLLIDISVYIFLFSLCEFFSGIYFSFWFPLSLLLLSEFAHACPLRWVSFSRFSSKRRFCKISLCYIAMLLLIFFSEIICPSSIVWVASPFLLLLLCSFRWVPFEKFLLLLGILANITHAFVIQWVFLLSNNNSNLSSELSLVCVMSLGCCIFTCMYQIRTLLCRGCFILCLNELTFFPFFSLLTGAALIRSYISDIHYFCPWK